MKNSITYPGWMKTILIIAGLYNIVWGSITVFFPFFYFSFSDMPLPNYPELWQCVGMIVGVYGIGYIIAAFDPFRHWVIILVGLIGKILGPIGYLNALLINRFTLKAGLTNIANDLIWWIPFAIILWKTYKFYQVNKNN